MARREWRGAGGAGVWDRHAAHYRRQLWLERHAIKTALALLAPTHDERVLDAGTGTGEALRRLARGPVRPRAVTAIDFSAAMLARLPALPDGWVAEQADLRALPHADASFDAALAAYVLHLLPSRDLPAALCELHRVLAPGGRLVTVTPAIPPAGLGRVLAATLDRVAWSTPLNLGGLRALDVRAALGAAGFSVHTTRWVNLGYPSLCTLSAGR
ncbi:MAG: class I SAM-dependent methyltransferase [Actinomycetota bacterium]|nr:class I SAM-dependent methyltransferase [Actinomycetota bacterium]